MDNTDAPPPEDMSTAEVSIVPKEPSASTTPEEPMFSGAQVRFLMQNMGPGGQSAFTSHEPVSPPERKGRGTYDSDFGWMHLLDTSVGVKLLFVLAFIALGLNYLISPNLQGAAAANPMISYNVPLLFGAAALVVVNIIVKWKRSHLYTTEKEVIFEVKPFWPLGVLRKTQRAKIQKIDTAIYTKNFLEEAFSMNSGTLTLDTPAQSGDLHELKGVKNAELLQQDVS